MKAIMLSMTPYRVEKLLNGRLLADVRNLFPKDFVGWVYIYCTKGKNLYPVLCFPDRRGCHNLEPFKDYRLGESLGVSLNGKVVARFWCDKVEEITPSNLDNYAKDSCLTIQELENYLWSNIFFGKAIHITKLEIFDKPKELSEFGYFCKNNNKREGAMGYCPNCKKKNCWYGWIDLTKAPKTYSYVEVEE